MQPRVSFKIRDLYELFNLLALTTVLQNEPTTLNATMTTNGRKRKTWANLVSSVDEEERERGVVGRTFFFEGALSRQRLDR